MHVLFEEPRSLRCVLCIFLLLIGAGCGREQKKQVWIQDGVEMVANPAVPLSRNQGRVLKLREHLRLKDTGEGFFFRSPAQPGDRLGLGLIFLTDQDQLLRFSSDRTFLGNLCRPGR